MTNNNTKPRGLAVLDPNSSHDFSEPTKRIHEGPDVTFFQTSKAYTDLMTFILQLNASLVPRKDPASPSTITTWDLGSEHVPFPDAVLRLRALLDDLRSRIARAPPDTGPRRFGNVSFRKWYQLAIDDAPALLDRHLPRLNTPDATARTELQAYLLGSFGSMQRLDYGTGHELSFLAFLAGIWKLGGFADADGDGAAERAIVLGVLEPYLDLVRTLIKTYTLEPAGSHGVWGLDDHSFLPYIFGSAQLAPPIPAGTPTPTEGSAPSAPDPSAITDAPTVAAHARTNLYFSAVAFIAAVKKGPFWEHSPMLYDISGVRAGWAKINKGMLRMYAAEVLAKFPVVQHFPFGALFRWERDPEAPEPAASAHHAAAAAAKRPERGAGAAAANAAGTRAPWAGSAVSSATGGQVPTRAPWAQPATATGMPPTQAPWAAGGGPGGNATGMPPTRAPWAKDR